MTPTSDCHSPALSHSATPRCFTARPGVSGAAVPLAGSVAHSAPRLQDSLAPPELTARFPSSRKVSGSLMAGEMDREQEREIGRQVGALPAPEE